MNDQDTLELRRMVDDDPLPAGLSDLATLMRSGQRMKTRRRVRGGGMALGTAAVLAVALLALTGGTVDGQVTASSPSAQEVTPAGRQSAPATGVGDGPECGVLSCLGPAGRTKETGTLIDELSIGTLPGGAQEILYVAATEGVGASAGRQIEVLSAGYRDDGQVVRTVWALEPGTPGATGAGPRFWSNPGFVNAPDGSGDHYVVLGYVDGSPEDITWSTPDGTTGKVEGLLRLDGYTAFYLTQPMPADYVAPPRATRNEDGSFTVETDNGPTTFRSGDPVTVRDLLGGATPFSPDLTIHTSDGWSCTLSECGTMG